MKRKIRVAFFAEILVPDFDGASRTMFQIISRIPFDNFEFIFFCGLAPGNDFEHEVIELPSINIPFNNTYKMALPFFSEQLITERLNKFRADVIHIASPSPLGHFALQYGKKTHTPVISIYHTHFLSYVDYYLRHLPMIIPSVKNVIASKQKHFYNNCDLVYVPTQAMIQELQNFSFDTQNMKLWQRGIDRSLFTPLNKDEAFIKNIVKNDKPNILYASRLVWEKNLSSLVDIYQKAKEMKLDYNFILAGDGVARQSLEEKMPDAFFLGNLEHEQLSKLYASSDVFVFPSISETYGNVVIEAMASGLPLVIANGGGTQSLVKDGHNGYVCRPNDATDYLDKIQLLLSDNRNRKRMVKNGFDFISQLSWDDLVQEYFEDLEMLALPDLKFAV